jgi:hypothetical protein
LPTPSSMRPSRMWGRTKAVGRHDLGHPASNPFGLAGGLANRPPRFSTVSSRLWSHAAVVQRSRFLPPLPRAVASRYSMT